MCEAGLNGEEAGSHKYKLVTEVTDETISEATLKNYFDESLEMFGAGRLCFGTDWPVCLLASSYLGVLTSALDSIGDLSPEQRNKFLAQNAVDFYRL